MSDTHNRSKTYSLSMNIDGFVRNNRYPKGYKGLFIEDGKTLSAAEARTHLALEKAKGRVVIPCSSECGNPCQHSDNGCTGFDYAGGGCPGRYSEAKGC
ncbi:MAG TPA: hypothetical protein VNO24_27870 [Blastocatellia bacterium]|nr:hypothetical protein [Blastocatellia bacterium]